MSELHEVNPLVQLQQAAVACGLKMEPKSLPRRAPIVTTKWLGRVPTFDAAAEFLWQIVGDPQNIKAFLEAITGIIGSYFAYRGSKSITIKTGGTEIHIRGTDDHAKAVAAIRALQAPAEKGEGQP